MKPVKDLVVTLMLMGFRAELHIHPLRVNKETGLPDHRYHLYTHIIAEYDGVTVKSQRIAVNDILSLVYSIIKQIKSA